MDCRRVLGASSHRRKRAVPRRLGENFWSGGPAGMAWTLSNGRRMIYVMWHAWTTHVVCLESCRVAGKYPYTFTERFSMLESLLPLPAFEQKFAAEVVRVVYAFHVEGTVSDPSANLTW